MPVEGGLLGYQGSAARQANEQMSCLCMCQAFEPRYPLSMATASHRNQHHSERPPNAHPTAPPRKSASSTRQQLPQQLRHHLRCVALCAPSPPPSRRGKFPIISFLLPPLTSLSAGRLFPFATLPLRCYPSPAAARCHASVTISPSMHHLPPRCSPPALPPPTFSISLAVVHHWPQHPHILRPAPAHCGRGRALGRTPGHVPPSAPSSWSSSKSLGQCPP